MRKSVALRRYEILPLLSGAGAVTVQDLAAQLGRSPVTIRRDLCALEEKGLVRRTHGGAMLSYNPGEELPCELASEVRKDQKEWIGRAADGLVKHGESILIDAGTTMAAFVRALSGKRDLKIVTNSIEVVYIAARENWTILCPGGVLRNKSYAFVGPAAEKGLESIRAETLFLAFNAICKEGWIYSLDSFSASMKQVMIGCASRVVALGDSSKIGKVGLIRVIPVSTIDILVTDEELEEDSLQWLLAHGIEVILAGPGRCQRYQPTKRKQTIPASEQAMVAQVGVA